MTMLSRAVLSFVALAAGLALFVKWRLSSYGVSPVPILLPDLPILPPDDRLTGIVERIGENDLVGPESLITTEHGGAPVMFAALGDGRIVRLTEKRNDGSMGWTMVVRTGQVPPGDGGKCGAGGPTDETDTEEVCGRPLGMIIVKRSTVDPNFTGTVDEDVIVVADAYKGLLMISGIHGDGARLHVLATRADGDDEDYSFQLLNGVVQAPDGSLYVTETSKYFQRRRIFHAAFDGKPAGRLLRYKKAEGVEIVADSLYMPNGVTLSHRGDALLIVAGVKILQYSLKRQEMEQEPLVPVMPGTGDNIKTFNHLPSGESRRCYWAGLGSKFAQPFTLLKALSERPKLRAVLVALLPYRLLVNLIPKLAALAIYDEEGNLIETYQDVNAMAPWLAEAEPMGSHIYLASWFNPFLARVRVGEFLTPRSSEAME